MSSFGAFVCRRQKRRARGQVPFSADLLLLPSISVDTNTGSLHPNAMLKIFVDEGLDLDIPNKVCNTSKPNSLLRVRASRHRAPNPLTLALRLKLREIEFFGILVDSPEVVFILGFAVELSCRCGSCVAFVFSLFEHILGIICVEGDKTSNPG